VQDCFHCCCCSYFLVLVPGFDYESLSLDPPLHQEERQNARERARSWRTISAIQYSCSSIMSGASSVFPRHYGRQSCTIVHNPAYFTRIKVGFFSTGDYWFTDSVRCKKELFAWLRQSPVSRVLRCWHVWSMLQLHVLCGTPANCPWVQ